MMQTFKIVSKFRQKLDLLFSSLCLYQPQKATLVIFGIIGFLAASTIAWFLRERTISEGFAQLNFWQENPPFWVSVPQVSEQLFLLAPTLILLLITQAVMKLSPQPKTWSRFVIISILFTLTVRYLMWRSLSTLNLSNPLNGIFSLSLLFMEMVVVFGTTIQLFLMLTTKERSFEAEQYNQAVKKEIFLPSVDILIPSLNEPSFILSRTIIGCQALKYFNKKIYLLDDGNRLEIKQLAKQLGCHYITRSDNRYAKAGNLNYAITQTSGELIVVFDADFVPTKNFLTRTVGFFQNKNIALVQTPQSFYNFDPIARNLGLEKILTSEEEIFYRQIQPLKDGAGSVLCSGTSFIVRRSALKEVGCFVTDSLSEDYYTGIRLSAQGYELVYLDEKLSSGLAAESISSHIKQRLRWVRGTLQGLFIDSNPLTIPGLNLRQRLAHLEGFLHWFSSIPRLFFLLIPLAYTFLGINPILVSTPEAIYFFLPYYLVNFTVFAWLNSRSRSAVFSDIYALVQCFPLAITVIKVILNPFKQEFKVTPKGVFRKRFYYNWTLAWPLIILLLATIVGFWINLNPVNLTPSSNINLGLIWSIYNLLMISIALLTLLDVPKPDYYQWFSLKKTVKLTSAEQTLLGMTTLISEGGVEIELAQFELATQVLNLRPYQCSQESIHLKLNQSLKLEIGEEGLTLYGSITNINLITNIPKIQVLFNEVSLTQQRRLVEMLFCCPGQWKRRKAPGEWQSLWLLLTVLIRPLLLFHQKKLNTRFLAKVGNKE